jgi:RNA polymerase sigma factor (TIGR02999 family)
MRRVLVDRARRKLAHKRPQAKAAVPLDEMIAAPDAAFEEILAVHDALDKLEAANKRQAQIAELKYFGGLTVEEIAEALSIAPATVKRDWKEAELWLRAALRGMLP